MRRINGACFSCNVLPLLVRRWENFISANEELELEKGAAHNTTISDHDDKVNRNDVANENKRSTSRTTATTETQNYFIKNNTVPLRRRFTKDQVNAFTDDTQRVVEEEIKEEEKREQRRYQEKLYRQEEQKGQLRNQTGRERYYTQQESHQEKYEMIYDVPILTPHVVGRERVLRELWQNILSNEHCQVMIGVNGMGKSTILAEFCERAKESKRFTCIKWFQLTTEPTKHNTLADAATSSFHTHERTKLQEALSVRMDHHSCQVRALRRELAEFIVTMKGRIEKDVLLVFDEVSVPEEVFKLLPRHHHLYVLMATSALPSFDNKFGQKVKFSVSSNNKNADPIAKEENMTNERCRFDVNSAKLIPVTPLLANDVNCFANRININSEVHALFSAMGHVPLLMLIASKLIEHDIICAQRLHCKLEEAKVINTSTHELSVSKVLKELCGIAIDAVRVKHIHAQEWLTLISCVNVGKVSSNVLHALCKNDTRPQSSHDSNTEECTREASSTETFLAEVVKLGLLQETWEGNAYSMHPTIQHVLQENLTSTQLEVAAQTLLELWPRRRGRLGEMSIATELVSHTQYLVQLYMAHSLPFTPTLLTCMDRSATFLCQYLGQQLDEAAELWYAVHQHNVHTLGNASTHKMLQNDCIQTEGKEQQHQSAEETSLEEENKMCIAWTPESVRVARECGRLLCKLRDGRAETVLQSALDQACQLYGRHSTQVALILGCLASYLPATQHNVELLYSAANALDEECQMVEEVRSEEERTMLLETLFILLARQAQMLSEMNQTVPVELEKQAKCVYELLSRK